MTISLSVVVPTFDTADLTAECVASALDRLPPGGELIVIDDASTDGTAARLAAAFPTVHLERAEVNRGFSASANRGVEISRGEIVLLLNSDTRVLDGALHALLAVFAADRRLGVAGAQLLHPDGSPQWSAGPVPTLPWLVVMASGAAALARPLTRWRRSAVAAPAAAGSGAESRVTPGQTADPTRRIVEVGWVTGAALAFRRAVWNEIGELSEDVLFYAQDLDFCLRARTAGWRVAVVPEARIEHLHGASIASHEELPYLPEKLWPDLLAWGRRWYGERWAARARWAMRGAAQVRLALRRVAEVFLAGERRRSWRQATAALRRGYDSLAPRRR